MTAHSYVTRTQSCKCVMSHINESCHISLSHVTYEYVMSHMNASCHISMKSDTTSHTCDRTHYRDTPLNLTMCVP